MSRTNRSLVWCFGLALGAVLQGGCSHLMETRAITAFSANLRDENLDGLLHATTDDFHQRALRTATALEDLKILNLPDGKSTIVEVEDVSESRKRVTVQVGEGKKEIFYELARQDSGQWVVDDIYLKQKKRGVVAYKSVTEQMDLLLTVREFLDSWSRGDRDQVLGVTSQEFRAALDPLPPSFLASLTRIVAAGRPTDGKYKPNAQLDDAQAVVRLPRIQGDTVITMTLVDNRWLVSDVAIDSKGDDQLPSMKTMAHAVNGCTAFLAAYAAQDRDKLSKVSSPEFYEGSLSVGDLDQVHLPDPQLFEHDLQVKLRGSRADFVLRNDQELVQIDMHSAPQTALKAPPRFLVSDVTIYEIETKQEKRLSALFTAQGMLDIFMRAMAARDVSTLKHASTRDMSMRVWSKLSPETIQNMPLEIFNEDSEFVAASFQGALTKIEMRHAGRPVTYLLREEYGRFFVDDVQWQLTGVPSSMKTTLEILVPVHEFLVAMDQSSQVDDQAPVLERLQANSSGDFNRVVWSQTRFVPQLESPVTNYLNAPLKGIAIADQEVTVQYGDNRFGAKVTLRREFDRFVIDDLQLIAGAEESQRVALKHALRTQLARGEARSNSGVIQASATSEAPAEPRQLEPEATAEPTNAPRELDDPFASDPR